MVRGSNSIKIQEWAQRLMRFRQFKLTVAQFCGAEGVSTSSFYKWQRRLRKLESTDSREDAPASPKNKRPAFQTVQVTTSAGHLTTQNTSTVPESLATSQNAVTVWLPGGIQVQVINNSEAVAAVIGELVRAGNEEAAC